MNELLTPPNGLLCDMSAGLGAPPIRWLAEDMVGATERLGAPADAAETAAFTWAAGIEPGWMAAWFTRPSVDGWGGALFQGTGDMKLGTLYGTARHNTQKVLQNYTRQSYCESINYQTPCLSMTTFTLADPREGNAAVCPQMTQLYQCLEQCMEETPNFHTHPSRNAKLDPSTLHHITSYHRIERD